MTRERTIADWIGRVAEALTRADLHYGHGTDNAEDEAAWLVLHAASLPLDGSFTDGERLLPEPVARRIDELVRARCETRKPLAYLTGSAFFAGLEFDVDEHVLVPRSPVAELILDRFRPWMDPQRIRAVLDLCTGSGCIAIACARAFEQAHVDAADISEDALAVAQINVERFQLHEWVRLVESDLFAGLGGMRYQLIISNPPYVSVEEMATLPEEYLHEPRLGLTAGSAGLDVVIRILAQAGQHLEPDGILVVEVGNSQAALAEAFPEVPFLWLDFERGGHGVFLLDVQQVQQYQALFENALG